MKSLWQIVSQVIGIPRILYEMRLYADIKDTKKQKQKWKREQMKWEINKSKWKKIQFANPSLSRVGCTRSQTFCLPLKNALLSGYNNNKEDKLHTL